MADYINVTSLNRLAKRVLEQCDPLNDLIVCGEISGFTRHYKSGHLYFTLKDENASIKTVMFRSQAQLLNFEPQNGMLVLVYGRATIYERDGAFQLYADYMKPFGAGAAQMAFDALYKKLEAEGLFAPERKRPLPAVPRCIGVVTSKTGAAWQDVQNVIGRRWPMVKLLLAPVSVQGIEAEKSIVDGIRRLDRDPRPDLILVTRGGGSKEDLWVFNSERIARAAAACRRPVVSAVGHEIDTSILDYVADHNSYKGPLTTNRLDWTRAHRPEFAALTAFYRGMLAIRRAYPRLSGAAGEPEPFILALPGWLIGFVPENDGTATAGQLAVYYNPERTRQWASLPAGTWRKVSDGVHAGVTPFGPCFRDALELAPTSVTVLVAE